HYLQYVLGLARLGHDVYFLEDSDDFPWACYDPDRGFSDTDSSYGLRFASAMFEKVGSRRAMDVFRCIPREVVRLPGPKGTRDLCLGRPAINISGSNPLRPWSMRTKRRVFIDTDPAFTQVRHLTNAARRERAARHNIFMSFGANIGKSYCTVPVDGFDWRPT